MNKKYPGPDFQLFFMFFYIFLMVPFYAFSQQSNNGYQLKTVVIDAGHGGKDPGSVGKRTTEKEVVLAIALKAGAYIKQQFPQVNVIYTRKTDVFVELYKRAEIANSAKADLFISIHANGNVNHEVMGTESLVLGLHRAGENFEVAKQENAVILLEDDYNVKYEGFDPNSPESYIIFSLMQNMYFEQSIHLAALVQDQFRDRVQRKDRGVKQQGLLVLARTSMPGILVETGFITNPEEEVYLMSEQGQDFLASAIFRAFRDYKEIIESRSSYVASNTEMPIPATDTITETHPPDKDSLQKQLVDKPVAIIASKVEFKVQIVASSKPMTESSREFKGFSDVSEYHIGNLYKYAVGSSSTFQDIIPYSKQVKERFPDAFIIAVKDNKIIPLDQALKESTKSEN